MAEESAIERATRLAAEERAKGEKPIDIGEAFAPISPRPKKYTLFLDVEVIDDLKVRAFREGTTVSDQIRTAVEKHLLTPMKDRREVQKEERQRRRIK